MGNFLEDQQKCESTEGSKGQTLECHSDTTRKNGLEDPHRHRAIWRQREKAQSVRISYLREFFKPVFGGEERLSIFAPRLTSSLVVNGPVAQLDRASHYGCEGLGFESLQGHREARLQLQSGFSFGPSKGPSPA